ncbi:GNAT family protein [Solwaraspora sp. WMMD1047]|uniref:GNAT family N-acetyltransferase n=1 Tax=Solwaraspora sp. WMMD1047 TaxID=3016102 RepID=UPI00241697A9|nr:GNAT family protein [Solwaraspora sp. WMMD1047]MDG4833713.1 GNAT family protein [Solwaraspora sp. WMMD1047]
MSGNVRLTPVDEQNLESLLSVAVAEADPDEVMPPVSAPVGWSHARREAFREFHRAHFGGLAGPTRTVMYAIVIERDVVGMIRLARHRDLPDVMETGIWLGRSAREQGIGPAALRAVLTEAAAVDAKAVVAETTAGNGPAIGLLRRCGAELSRTGDAVHAEIRL